MTWGKAAALLDAVAAVITRAKCTQAPALPLALWLNISLLIVGCLLSLTIVSYGLGAGLDYPFLFSGWNPMDGYSWRVIIVLAILMFAVSVGLAMAYQTPQLIAAFWGYVFFRGTPATLGPGWHSVDCRRRSNRAQGQPEKALRVSDQTLSEWLWLLILLLRPDSCTQRHQPLTGGSGFACPREGIQRSALPIEPESATG